MKSMFLLLVLFVSVVAGAEERSAPGQKQTAEKGGVTVSVIPLNLAESGKATIDLRITLDTHSGALPSDIRAFARLIGEGGAEVPPITWSSGKGGHHVSGTLSFPAAGSEERGVLTFILKSVDGQNDFRFEWEVPSKSARNTTGGAR
jgi:hypothetical protein